MRYEARGRATSRVLVAAVMRAVMPVELPMMTVPEQAPAPLVPAPVALAPPRAAMQLAAPVEIVPVRTRAQRNAFIRFQYTLYREYPAFVPPLLVDRKRFLDPAKNPWFEFGKATLFLALRGGAVVGRIAAVEDPRYNEFQGTRAGFFGLFECIDDASVARALLGAVEAHHRALGFTEVLGPASFSSNGEWSFLVDGFDQMPALMLPYNPPYYPALVEACGYAKAKDLWAWELGTDGPVPEKIARISEKIRQREGVTIRTGRLDRWDAEVATLKSIYNAAWEKNWGFVPMTDREFEALGRELKPIIKPELVLVAEVKGEPVAFAITVPDPNPAIKKANGRLFPFGLLRMLLELRRVRRGRLVAMGIKREYRKRGLDSLLVYETFTTAKRLGWSGGEISWTLEDNDLVNRAIEVFGAKRSKTYRVYSKALGGSSGPAA